MVLKVLVLIIQLFVARNLAEYAREAIVEVDLEEQKIVALRTSLTRVFHANLHQHLV
jgi:hypothetical protein